MLRNENRRRRRRLLVGLAAIAALLVGLAVLGRMPRRLPPIGRLAPRPPRPTASDNAMGNPAAPVTIDEFSDFQCSGCRRFHQNIEPQLVAEYVATNKVYFMYHTMGAWLGPESVASAEAAYCAGDQGRFWEYHDALFDHGAGENRGAFSEDRLMALAAALALDRAAFRDCSRTHKYAGRLERDRLDGQRRGVTGTPTFFINGQMLVGGGNYELLKERIEQALHALGH